MMLKIIKRSTDSKIQSLLQDIKNIYTEGNQLKGQSKWRTWFKAIKLANDQVIAAEMTQALQELLTRHNLLMQKLYEDKYSKYKGHCNSKNSKTI